MGRPGTAVVAHLHFCEAMVSHTLEIFQETQASRWPGLPGRPVSVGGMTVTYAQAAAALEALSGSGGVMVAAVLTAAGSPLAGCDYHAAAAPFLGTSRFLPGACGTGRGAAGRPVTRMAFMAAIEAALAAAREAEPARHYARPLAAAKAAFASDCGYAAAMATAAAEAARRAHAARLRTFLMAGIDRAVSACGRRRGEFTCTAAPACGTGGCRFAAGVLSTLNVTAAPGRLSRPANHVPGTGFSVSAALSALAEAVPYVPGVRVCSADYAEAADRPAL